MTHTTFVVKRQGKRPTEPFSPEKLHASIVAVCLSVHAPEGLAESTASAVSDAVTRWLDDKPEVTSDDIRRKAAEVLAKYHSEAAHLYKHHHMVI
jgi:2-phosphoglycerate kinase